MDALEKAKWELMAHGYTCVLCDGDAVLPFTARGVRPLVELIDSGRNVAGFVAADKVVGRGAAFLYVLLGVPRLYAGVISRPALMVLRQYGVAVEYGTLVDGIRNRRGDGMCPFEQAVLDVATPDAAYAVIAQMLRRLSQGETVG